MIARYCDILLKKSSKNPEEAELEDTLNQVLIRFDSTCIALTVFVLNFPSCRS